MKLLRILLFLPLAAMLSGCRHGSVSSGNDVGDTLNIHYSELLQMVHYPDYWLVSIKNPWHKEQILHTYMLVNRSDSAAVEPLSGATTVYLPVERSVVFTTAHCQLLYWLQAEEAIKGVCDLKYIHIPNIGKRVVDCGDGMLPMVERIAELQPQALLVSPFENSGGYGRLENIGTPLVETADYMETSSLGRAEWMRFYGLLYGREKQADSLFQVVENSYKSLKQQAERLPKGRSLLTERKTGSVWYVPGGRSSLAITLSDANAGYAFSADGHSGSLALSFEEVLDKAGQSDAWLIKYNGHKPFTRADLLAEFHGYKAMKAWQTGEVYACDTERKRYFEEVSFRPDYLLKEVILLAHPELMKGDSLRYYERLQ
ncbi:MAG: ABC transporter substrate-binding protein [Prevotella sp.]|nr:ABC transporter substrate-binding protein [Prevotella sp.]